MAGRTLYEAWVSHVEPLRAALQCITPERFVLRESPQGLRADKVYSCTVNNMNPVPLKGGGISIVVGQTIRINRTHTTVAQERYIVEVLSYAYGFKVGPEPQSLEILTFHWDGVDSASGGISPGHLHIGRRLLAQPTPIRPGDFQNAHVPTGYLSIATMVRFAITELGVSPLNDDWVGALANEQ